MPERRPGPPSKPVAPDKPGADPDAVTIRRVVEALAHLGIDHRDVARLEVTPDCVTVTRYRRDADGHLIAAGGEVANVTTAIGVTTFERTSR